jgi:hypothetical protein
MDMYLSKQGTGFKRKIFYLLMFCGQCGLTGQKKFVYEFTFVMGGPGRKKRLAVSCTLRNDYPRVYPLFNFSDRVVKKD